MTSSLYLGEEDMNEGVGASVLVNGCVRSGGKLLHVVCKNHMVYDVIGNFFFVVLLELFAS